MKRISGSKDGQEQLVVVVFFLCLNYGDLLQSLLKMEFDHRRFHI